MIDHSNIDLCAASLLNELAALDDPAVDQQPEERQALLCSALETARWLLEHGGGPFEVETIERIAAALSREIGS